MNALLTKLLGSFLGALRKLAIPVAAYLKGRQDAKLKIAAARITEEAKVLKEQRDAHTVSVTAARRRMHELRDQDE